MPGETEDLDALAKAKAAFYMMNDPALGANLKLRERIALAQMTRRNAYPKTFGEGLASIGDSLSDAWMARSLDKEDTAAAKSASGYTGPPAAAAPSRSYAPEDANTVVPAARPQVQPVTPPLLPAVPLPPDQQQSDEPGAPVRMPTAAATQDWRNANPLPSIARPPVPPQQPPPTTRAVAPPPPPDAPAQPGNEFNSRFAPAVGGGQQSALPGVPVMAEGNEPSADEMNAGRNALAQALMQQQAARGGPQPLPTTRAVTPPPAGGDTGIRAAPPAAPPVHAMPEQPGAVAGWVPAPAVSKPRERPLVGMSQEEADLTRDLAIKVQRNPYMAQSPAAMRLQTLQRDREARQKDADKVYEAQIARETKQQELHTTGRMDQAKRIVDVQREQEAVIEARNKNQLRAQFANMDPDTVFKTMTESSKVASSAAKSLAASQSAIQALNAGAITGAGAEARLDIAKFFHNMGLPDKGNVIANTETFRGAMQPVVASIMHQTSGTSQLSEGELRFAAKAAAGDITLDAQSVRMLTTIIDKASRGVIADHQKKMDVLFPDNPQAKALFGVEPPKPPAPSAGTPDGTTATGPNGAKMIRRNGQWEPM